MTPRIWRARHDVAAPGAAFNRRLLILAVVAALAVAMAWIGVSRASYTTASTSDVTATAVGISGWLHLYSSGTDPDPPVPPGYATKNRVAPATVAATGQDDTLAVDWGLFPDTNPQQYVTYTRAFTFKTLSAFPVTGVNQVTITASFTTPTGEPVIINNLGINTIGTGGGGNSVTLGVNQKRQVNVTVTYRKQWARVGDVLRPHILLTLTYAGGPLGYYVFDVPTTATITN